MEQAPSRYFAAALLLFPAVVLAQPGKPTLAECARIAADRDRLACYDRLAAHSPAAPPPAAPLEAPAPVPASAGQAEAPPPTASSPHSLESYWELDPEYKRGTFQFRPYRDNYALLLNYTFAPNTRPFRPFDTVVPEASDLSHAELDYQLSFKLKLLQDVSRRHVDLWFGYTQQSFWQAYHPKASSPFRETDYQPELMAVMPVDYHFLGLHGRFLNLGLVHQSNGQSSSLSRSWNRLYLQTGLERGNFSVLGRVWKRFNEKASDDDNPDIVDYMGYGDIAATYRWNGNRLSMLLRQNFRTSRGATSLNWAFPLARGIKGYVQLFSGYGQSLIDYNYSQKSIGFGVLIGD